MINFQKLYQHGRIVIVIACALPFLIACATEVPKRSVDQNSQAAESIKVLIVDGFSNHDWLATTKAIQSILNEDEAIEVTVSTVPPENSTEWAQWKPGFSNYDVVIQNTNDIKQGGSWPEPAQNALEVFVSGGGGLLAHHSANNAFPDWPAYNNMIGLGWRNKKFGPAIVIENGNPVLIPAGEGDSTGHGERADTLITRMGEHPIHQGLPRQWMAADIEVYRYARGPAKNLTVLAYAKDRKSGLNFPIEWAVNYGNGRVYTSTYGHYWTNLKEEPPGIRCIAFRTLLNRSVRWLAKANIPETVPEHFPSKDSSAWK